MNDDVACRREQRIDTIAGWCGIGAVGIAHTLLAYGNPSYGHLCTWQHGHNRFVGHGGCYDVCDDCVSTMTDENKVLIASLGGVELVLSALGKHSSHARVQQMGFGALRNLAVNG